MSAYESGQPFQGFPGEAVDRHLKAYGHLPELGCCKHDQPEVKTATATHPPEPAPAAPPAESKRKKGFSSNQKTRITAMVTAKIQEKGGRFLSINWNKKAVHFLDAKGNRCVGHAF